MTHTRAAEQAHSLIVSMARQRWMKMSRRRYVALLLIVAGIIWWLVNKQLGEGPILWHYAEGHALTFTDLLSVAAFAVAVLLWLPRRSSASRNA